MTAVAIVQYYLDTFVSSYKDCTDKIINISSLINYRTNWSPVNLPYEEKTQSIKNLSAAIIVNFTNAHGETVMYPKRGLDSLTKIVTGSITSADVVCQQIFMVHITKRKMKPELFLYLMAKTALMTIHIMPTNERVQWVQLVKKVIRNKEINNIVDACVIDFTIDPHRSPCEYEEEINVTLVENGAPELRGFAGFNEIYLHVSHFQDKIDKFSGDVEMLQLICKIDLISLAIHELSHLKIRKSNGNFNMHTPVLAALKGLPSNCNEFGAYAEKRFFDYQVDWFKSANNNGEVLDVGYIEAFINAVETNTNLPPLGQIEGALPRIEVQGMGAADLHFNEYIC